MTTSFKTIDGPNFRVSCPMNATIEHRELAPLSNKQPSSYEARVLCDDMLITLSVRDDVGDAAFSLDNVIGRFVQHYERVGYEKIAYVSLDGEGATDESLVARLRSGASADDPNELFISVTRIDENRVLTMQIVMPATLVNEHRRDIETILHSAAINTD